MSQAQWLKHTTCKFNALCKHDHSTVRLIKRLSKNKNKSTCFNQNNKKDADKTKRTISMSKRFNVIVSFTLELNQEEL